MKSPVEEPRTTYICRACDSMFFSPTDIVEHKAMTGHREYTERKSQTSSAA